MRLGARAGFKRNERMLSLDPRYVVAFPGNGVLERLVIEAKSRRITVVDRRGPLGTSSQARGAGYRLMRLPSRQRHRRWRSLSEERNRLSSWARRLVLGTLQENSS
jgi:hypothetical protein